MNERTHTGKIPEIIKKSDKHFLLTEFYSNVGEDKQENKYNNYRLWSAPEMSEMLKIKPILTVHCLAASM